MTNYELPFSKGLCDGAGDNRMPYAYATDLRNVRIINQVTTVRKGFKAIVSDIVGTTVKGLVSNTNLFVIVDSKLKQVDFTTGTYTNIGSLPNDNDVNCMTFGKYTIILTGEQPYVYDGTTLYPVVQSTSTVSFVGTGLNDMTVRSSATNIDGQSHTFDIEITGTGTPNTFKWRIDGGTYTTGVSITGGIHILSNGMIIIFNASTGHTLGNKWVITQDAVLSNKFGTEFLNFTWVAGDTNFKNVVYQSVPITATNQNLCYDWLGTGANQLIMKSPILGLVSTLSRLIIFTEKTIEWIDRNSYTTIGGILNFYPNPLAQGEKLVNSRCAISAGEKVFFLTTDKKIKTIDYVSGVDDLKVGDLSDDEKVGIPNFMNNLNDDLTGSCGFYDKKNKLIKFFVKSKSSLFIDTCIIWDLVNKTFLVDNNKFYSILCEHNNNVYAGNCLNSMLYQDEFGTDDDGQNIDWYRISAPLSKGRQNKNKITTSVATSGTINKTTSIRKDIIQDGDNIDTSIIEKQSGVLLGTGGSATGELPTGGFTDNLILKNFTKHRGPEYINSIGKYLQIKYSGSGVGQDFTLETIETEEKLTNYEETTDK